MTATRLPRTGSPGGAGPSLGGARRAPRRAGPRSLTRLLHRVLGLAAGLVLVVTGLTGSALVFRDEIDAALNPRLRRVVPVGPRAPLQPVLDRVTRAFPGEAPTRVRMPRRPGDTYELWLGAAPSRYVYADPYRGVLLGARRPAEFLTGWLFLMHSQLLSGAAGGRVAGVCALILVALSVSGLVVWWPRAAPGRAWRAWRRALTVTRAAGPPRVAFDLHRAVGFYASGLLLVAGVTGASLVFHESFERAAYWVTASAPPPREPAVLRAPKTVHRPTPLSADLLLAIAERAQPGGTISYLYLPAGPGQPFRVRRRLPGERHPNGKSFVHVDPAAGRVLAVEDGSRATRGARLYSVLYPLHTGVLGGAPTRALAVAGGLSLPVLALSGLLVWWHRARRRRAGPGAPAGRLGATVRGRGIRAAAAGNSPAPPASFR